MKRFLKISSWIAILAANVLVPYLLLADHGSFTASFLFWTVLTAGVLVWAWFVTRHWIQRYEESDSEAAV
ncbi:MAG: hypothetical protein ACOC0D_10855 [Spirochaeta sp.]